jgi:NADP-dependent 3-hydroxy-3-methylglutaryl-CoA reductase
MRQYNDQNEHHLSGSDRRGYMRHQVEETLAWKVAFSLGNTEFEGVIANISQEGMGVRLTTSISGASHFALAAEPTMISIHIASEIWNIKVRVIRTSFHPASEQQMLHCQLMDDETKARVWNLIYNLSAGGDRHAAQAIPSADLDRIPERGLYTEQARLSRLEFLQRKTGEEFLCIKNSNLIAHRLVGNIENHIGGVEVPLGLAGPLLFKGKNVQGTVYAPFATSEGALVASATRGSLLLSKAGGVTTRVISQRMMRSPKFVMDSLDSALFFSDWLKNHVPDLQKVVAQVSKHACLQSVDITLTGRVIHACFIYSTGDAAGQNMTTAATWHACQWAIAQSHHFKNVFIEGFTIESGASGDKKVNYKSFIEGRGTRVIAEAFIPAQILEKVMRVTVDQLIACHSAGLATMLQVGAIGCNVNVANTIAAIFTATGQDIACVHESSLAHFHLEKVECGVYATMQLPSLIVGTVGGGSALPGQAECLKMMDCYGSNKGGRLAEIIAGFCLALDLSTMSAIVNGSFVKAHERLGRNRPVTWFKKEDLTAQFFEKALQDQLDNRQLTVHEFERTNNFNAVDSIITELSARKQEKLLGLFPYRIEYQPQQDGERHSLEVIVKSKPLDSEVIMLANKMAGMCSSTLGELYDRFKAKNESAMCHVKELAIYGQKDSRFTAHAPKVYGIVRDDKREVFIVLIERLYDMALMGSVDKPWLWQPPHIRAALDGLAQLHSIWYERTHELKKMSWMGFVQDAGSMAEQKPLMKELIRHASLEFPELVGEEMLVNHYRLLDSIEKWWAEIDAMPKTLIHNDFNPRNIGLRANGGDPKLCVYDWELATIHLPQRDLAEFLAFIITSETTDEEIWGYVEQYRERLSLHAAAVIDEQQFRRGFELALYDFALTRTGLYLMAHTFKNYSFIGHLLGNLQRLMVMVQSRCEAREPLLGG